VVDVDVVTGKLAELARRVARARDHCPPSPEALAQDDDALDLVAFNLMLAVQACADIASHLLADEGLPAASSLAESFRALRDHGVISAGTADALSRAVGLRNVVAHGYSRIDAAMVHAAATRGLGDLATFEREVASWLRTRTDGPA
jgi:uncharacterized protein YutE (UPF0331/DUF86 family)